MKETWLPTGASDPVSFTCTCPALSKGDGLVLLFYRYFDATPSVPTSHYDLKNDPASLASFHATVTRKLEIGGKIRIAREGFNVTIGGTKFAVEDYMQECISHWSFAGLDLSTQEKQYQFFKPTCGGCACVFGGSPASVRVTSEITPMGVTNYIPAKWDRVESLSPAEFHERCHSNPNTMLVDVRNHYESRIGYFIDPKSGEPALRPALRRFSQWPQYVKRRLIASGENKPAGPRNIMTYCTGGIRCEKGARFLQENLDAENGDQVCTLHGGIAAYLTWMDDEISSGRKSSEESLFRGKNYVFDARGSTGLYSVPDSDPISTCHDCKKPCDRLSKCRSRCCHLILVICDDCELKTTRCCQSCEEFDKQAPSTELNSGQTERRPVCFCEKEREAELWGATSEKDLKIQGWKKNKRKLQSGTSINIQVMTIQ